MIGDLSDLDVGRNLSHYGDGIAHLVTDERQYNSDLSQDESAAYIVELKTARRLECADQLLVKFFGRERVRIVDAPEDNV